VSTNTQSPVQPFGELAPLREADRELVDNAWAWWAWIQEQKAQQAKAAHKGLTCPKDDELLTWDNVRRAYTCDSCGWIERAV